MEADLVDTGLALSQRQGLVFGLLTLPICAWVVYTDIRDMKIRNNAVLALFAVYLLAGPFLFPIQAWLWGFFSLAVVLAIGFGLNAVIGIGAGDAKFAAAMAPFVYAADTGTMIMLYIFWSVVLLIGMFAARKSAAVREKAPDWIWLKEEWRGHVPFGVGLAPTLTSYFALAAFRVFGS